jgi:hypothetical protein
VAGGEGGQLSRRSPSNGAPGTRWAFFAGPGRSRRRIDDHRTMRRANDDRLGRSRHACGMGQRQGAHERVRCHRERDHEQRDRLQHSRPPSHVAWIVHSDRESYGRHTTGGGIRTFQVFVRARGERDGCRWRPLSTLSWGAGTPPQATPGIVPPSLVSGVAFQVSKVAVLDLAFAATRTNPAAPVPNCAELHQFPFGKQRFGRQRV